MLARGLREGKAAIQDELDAASAALDGPPRRAPACATAPCARAPPPSTTSAFQRGDYETRRAAQDAALGLPPLPTTTIGSFPQTGAIRKERARFAKGEIDQAEYEGFLEQEIRDVVELQERIGLDVLVHGEPERNDMVQYFAENLDGFAVTQNGWVQSYGSRATRPSILWGDVSRPGADHGALVDVHAEPHREAGQGHADRPGDDPRVVVRARRPAAGRDRQPGRPRPARRDRRPRGRRHRHHPGRRARAARAAAAQEARPGRLPRLVGRTRSGSRPPGVEDTTQIHTHLCYSEFGVVLDAIDRLDADVTSIEAARSRGRSSPSSSAAASAAASDRASTTSTRRACRARTRCRSCSRPRSRAIPQRQVWVNPDCGLKTRGYDETVASLENMLAATLAVREQRRRRTS